ncbi:Bug family tripartite tricarboxylate transporter substrate binding protein [Elioraea sp.]|uniref:Bug family tripartite tricarboxylate transporter substrate binding protein n=1 Tax=Elioraea sp. TaxID=2185103 RepID=UPI003F714972
MLTRRTALLAGGAALAGSAAHGQAAFPTRPIRLIIPFAAGGGTDVPGRILADAMTTSLGQPVVVENRTGAGGTIGMELTVRAAPDGYTLVLTSNGAMSSSKLIYPNLAFDPQTDLLPISNWFKVDNVIAVKADSRFRRVADVLEAARKEPGKITFGSGGHGSTLHLMGEMFQYRAGVQMVHVPYRGGAAALTDLIAGNLDTAFDSTPSIGPQIKAGAVRALAVCGATRSPFFPDVPTMTEEGIRDFQEFSWGGVFAPRATPAPVVERLAAAIIAAGRNPAVIARMAQAYAEAIPNTPAEFARVVRDEAARWEPVVRAANIVAN